MVAGPRRVAFGGHRSSPPGKSSVVRDLVVPATGLASPVVWAEVFAALRRPADRGAVVPNSRPALPPARSLAASSVRLTYQAHADGGCANTLSYAEGSSFVQATGSAGGPGDLAPDVVSLSG
jgi:hypothetical protein